MDLRASTSIKIFMAQCEAITLGPYQDGDHLSIGLGHNEKGMRKSKRITVRQAFDMFAEDLIPREQRVNDLLKKEVPQHVFDALLSLHYQSGNRYMPAIAHLVNYNEMGVLEVAYPMCAYSAAGEWKKGLHQRRKDELQILLKGDYGDLEEPIKLWRGPPVGSPEMYVLQPGDID